MIGAGVSRAVRGLRIMVVGALLATSVALLGLLFDALPRPALLPAGWLVFLGLSLAFVVSNAALQYGAARLPTNTTSLVMLTEILFASVSAAALGAAVFSPRILWGGSLIVLAAFLAALAHHEDQM